MERNRRRDDRGAPAAEARSAGRHRIPRLFGRGAGRGAARLRFGDDPQKGKLPGKTIPHTYDLEYGTDTVEIQSDAIETGQRVVVIDDLLATGGTAAAAVRLCRMVGGNVVGDRFHHRATGLKGRDRLDVRVTSLLTYEF